MKTFITSDLHLSHSNIIKYCPRTRGHFRDVHHMNEEMINMWNELVEVGSTIYILGDVAFSHSGNAVKLLQRMNGNKILIKGNHDRKNLRDTAFRACFSQVHDYLCTNYNGTTVVMFHYPMLEWENMHRGAVHFYGHVHQNDMPELAPYRARNVGFDYTGKIAMSMEEAISNALSGEIKAHHGD